MVVKTGIGMIKIDNPKMKTTALRILLMRSVQDATMFIPVHACPTV